MSSSRSKPKAITIDVIVRPLEDLRGGCTMKDVLVAAQHVIPHLAGLDQLVLGAAKEEAKRILKARGIQSPASVATMIWKAARKHATNGQALVAPDPKPWPEPVDPTTLLASLSAEFSNYCILPPHAADALALWAVFTHKIDDCNVNPYIVLTSPTARCGKTRVLEMLAGFVTSSSTWNRGRYEVTKAP